MRKQNEDNCDQEFSAVTGKVVQICLVQSYLQNTEIHEYILKMKQQS